MRSPYFFVLIFNQLETILKINKNTLKKVCSYQNRLYICPIIKNKENEKSNDNKRN